jgi:hypothetical protein
VLFFCCVGRDCRVVRVQRKFSASTREGKVQGKKSKKPPPKDGKTDVTVTDSFCFTSMTGK